MAELAKKEERLDKEAEESGEEASIKLFGCRDQMRRVEQSILHAQESVRAVRGDVVGAVRHASELLSKTCVKDFDEQIREAIKKAVEPFFSTSSNGCSNVAFNSDILRALGNRFKLSPYFIENPELAAQIAGDFEGVIGKILACEVVWEFDPAE